MRWKSVFAGYSSKPPVLARTLYEPALTFDLIFI